MVERTEGLERRLGCRHTEKSRGRTRRHSSLCHSFCRQGWDGPAGDRREKDRLERRKVSGGPVSRFGSQVRRINPDALSNPPVSIHNWLLHGLVGTNRWCLLLPAFRRATAARDLTGLVKPLALHLDPGGVFLSLRRHLHRIAHLFLPVLGENDLRSG